jgi:hypothetical protein
MMKLERLFKLSSLMVYQNKIFVLSEKASQSTIGILRKIAIRGMLSHSSTSGLIIEPLAVAIKNCHWGPV